MQTFVTRSAFEVPISETHEWHSNIRMQDGGTFECIRMHIPSTCGGVCVECLKKNNDMGVKTHDSVMHL